MTYEQFWYGPPRLAVSFRQAEKLRAERANADMWRHGLYMMAALDASVGNMFRKKGSEPIKYLAEPLPLTEEEVEYRKERDDRERQDRIREKFREYAAKGGGKHGK